MKTIFNPARKLNLIYITLLLTIIFGGAGYLYYSQLSLSIWALGGFIILILLGIGACVAWIYNLGQKKLYQEMLEREKDFNNQQKKFKVTMDSLGEGVITLDTAGKIVYMNRQAEVYTEWKLSDAKGKNLHDVYPVRNEETGMEENNILKKVLKQGIVKELANHTILISKSGKEIPVMDTGAPVFDESGATIGVAIAFQDETEKRRQAKLLKESEERLRTTLDSLLEGCQIINKDWRYVYLNNSAASHGKSSRDELLNKSMMEVYPGIENTELFQIMKDCMENKVIQKMENEFTYNDGNKGWFELSMEPVKEGLFILSVDITERKKSEEALRDSEEKYRQLVENVNDIIFSVDENLIIDYISPVIEDVLGYSPEELTGKSFHNLFNRMKESETVKIIEELKNGKNKTIDLNLLTQDGEKRWIRISRAKIIKNNKLVGLRGVISDVTEKLQALEKLRIAKEKAEEMNRMKTNFLSNMSHELRTPLIGILGGSELVLEELADVEHREMVRVIYESGKRLHETVNQILDLSRLESNSTELKKTEFAIENLLNRLTDFYASYKQPKVKFELINNAGSLQVNSDEKILQNIISNLINNSIKFTVSGFIILKADTIEADGLVYLKISVKDSGIGISDEDKKIIFNEFRQVSEGYTRKFEGTGLGLTLAKKYTELLGGKISVESVPGVGSEFSIEIPVNNAAGQNIADKEDIKIDVTVNEAINKPVILLIDDDEVTREIIPKTLHSNFIVETAEDEDSGLKKIYTKQYDLLLLDIGLRGNKDGIDVLNEIRKNSDFDYLPIIAFTAFAMSSEEKKFRSAGFNDYISKPFTKRQLIDVINRNILYKIKI